MIFATKSLRHVMSVALDFGDLIVIPPGASLAIVQSSLAAGAGMFTWPGSAAVPFVSAGPGVPMGFNVNALKGATTVAKINVHFFSGNP